MSIKPKSNRHGQPPGTLLEVDHGVDREVELSVIHYTADRVDEQSGLDVAACRKVVDGGGITWINVDGVHDAELIARLGEAFDIHSLVLEDINTTDQRPKFEDYESYAFVVIKMLYEGKGGRTVAEQVSIVIGKNYVISFQERPGDVFDLLRRRIRDGKGRIRKMKADYLGYCLMDAIVDNYFVVLEKFGDLVAELEDSIIEEAREELLGELFSLKREGVFLRKVAWPVRELVSSMDRAEPRIIGKEVRPFLRDLYDHVVQVVDTVETMRESVSGMLDIYLSSVSNRMNEVMKVLTIIGSIFIPMTFIAGIYGMNFDPDVSPWNMPELAWRYGYPAALALMAIVAGGMLLYFKRKKWI